MAGELRRETLFDAPASPVLPAAADWTTGAVSGSAAAALCVIAVAFLGIALMSGRLAIREGLRVALGCFVLLGAPAIAMGLRDVADDTASAAPEELPAIAATPIHATPPPLPPRPAASDPYAGFALPSD